MRSLTKEDLANLSDYQLAMEAASVVEEYLSDNMKFERARIWLNQIMATARDRKEKRL